MPNLYITKQGARVTKKGGRVCVNKDDCLIQEIPAIKLEQIVIFGRVSISTPVITYCLKEGIDVVFLSSRGKYYGRLQSPLSGNPDLRNLQYHACSSHEVKLELSKLFIAGKLRNMHVLLLRHARGRKSLENIAEQLVRFQKKIDKAIDVATVRGIEGAAARHYFGVFDLLCPSDFPFSGRHRRPPTDPVNCLLSFGYTLLNYNMLAAVNIAGLDPYLGFLHERKYGRPSISLDLIEEYRPLIVDTVALSCMNKRIIQPRHFESPKKHTVFLTEEGRRLFLREYERRMLTKFQYGARPERISYRDSMQRQVARLIRKMKGEDDYAPVLMR